LIWENIFVSHFTSAHSKTPWVFTMIALVAIGARPALAVDSNFTPAGVAGPNSYSWNTSANWDAGVPNAAGDTATFVAPADSAVRTVDLTNNVTLGTLRFTNDNSNNPQETILSSSTGSKLIFLGSATGGAGVITSARATGSGDAQESGNEIAMPIQIGLNDGNAAHAAQLFLNVGYRRDSQTGLALSSGISGDANSTLYLNNQGQIGNTTGFGYANVTIASSPFFQGNTMVTAGGLRITDNSLPNAGNVTVGFGGQFDIDGTPANVSLGSSSTLTLSGPGKVTSAGAGHGFGFDGALRYQSTSGTTNFNSPIDFNGGQVWTSGLGAGAGIFVNASVSSVGTLNLEKQVTGSNNANGTNRALTKEGGGVLQLSSPIGSFYEGGTWVREGSLLIDNVGGSGSATGRRFVTVAPGATLGGAGAIDTTLTLTNNFEPLTSNSNMTPNGTRAVTIAGTLAPGLSPQDAPAFGNIGLMNITTDLLAFTSTGTLQIDLGGTTAGTTYDRVQETGAAQLAGTLQIRLTNGYQPSLGDSFTVLRYTSETGDFSNYLGTYLGGFLSLHHTLTATGLVLTARPAQDGDISLDGIVNGLDINQVASNWLKTGPAGDVNGDGIVNGLDVNIIATNWLHSYNPGGGSGSGTATSVPEPTAGVLALVGFAFAAAWRRRATSTRK
jgi:MYXO-CTERM domain-containing protein